MTYLKPLTETLRCSKQQLRAILAESSLQIKPGALPALITDLCALQDNERHISIQLLEVSRHFKYVNCERRGKVLDAIEQLQ